MATLRQLKAFVITAEYKKMSEAARHLFISQPTVSQIISELEKSMEPHSLSDMHENFRSHRPACCF